VTTTSAAPAVQHGSGSPTKKHAVQRETPGVWSAVRSNLFLVVIIVLVFTVAGAAAGLKRSAKYSATSTLAVLHLNFGGSAGALNAFSTAAPELADTYARSINADGVVQPLSKQFHTSVTAINNDLSAASVPASPELMVTAQTASSKSAIRLANAAMTQLLSYLQSVNGADPEGTTLYAQLKAADATVAADENKVVVVKANIQHSLSTTHAFAMSATQQAELGAAQSAETLAADQANTLNATYQQSRLDAANTQYLQPLASATTAKSDRVSKLLLYAFVGLVVGIGVATGVAVIRQARRLKKLRAA